MLSNSVAHAANVSEPERLNCCFLLCHHSQTALIQSQHDVQSSSVGVWRQFWPHPTFTGRKALTVFKRLNMQHRKPQYNPRVGSVQCDHSSNLESSNHRGDTWVVLSKGKCMVAKNKIRVQCVGRWYIKTKDA
jgi:hypothetical protein